MPAYLMQSMANCLHEYKYKYNENGEIEKDYKIDSTKIPNDMQTQFINARMSYNSLGVKWSMLLSEGLFKVIDNPHYTESYYKLTKEISTTDFR